MSMLCKVAHILAAIGAINWGLILFNFNLVAWLQMLLRIPYLAQVVYALVGLSGIYVFYCMFTTTCR